MMSDLAICATDISKAYRIPLAQGRARYQTLREDVSTTLWRLLTWIQRAPANRSSETMMWALKDVSFEVKQGEVLGIIGRNGAGKSTLLKILSRITEPTRGRVEIYGRVGSLLEIGTGFHPELTGRENIYLSGAVLGMRRSEITQRFDAIVAFAEVEQFVDTPVKRYSSGMYMRLAFAVAAHLEPEILLVDEVLAVGDAAFQKKCLGKMQDVADTGRTVLFVSHQMATIQALCQRTLLLDQGTITANGPTEPVIQQYLQSVIAPTTTSLADRVDRKGDGSVRICSLQIESLDDDRIIRSGSRLKLAMTYRSDVRVLYPQFFVEILDYSNTCIYTLDSDAVGGLRQDLAPTGRVMCITDAINLTAGRCYVHVAVLKGGSISDYVQYALAFDVEADDLYGTGKTPPREWALGILRHGWQLEE